jgi:hypothetical protein
MDDTDLVWFCGFYEGEGCICNDISNNMRFRVCISQNDRTPLYLGKKRWGGVIRERTRISLTGKTCKGYEWVMYYNDAKKFIHEIYPYMKIPYKKNQVDAAILLVEKGIERRFGCSYCDNDYASPSGRRRHIRSVHETEDTDISRETGDTIKLREHP